MPVLPAPAVIEQDALRRRPEPEGLPAAGEQVQHAGDADHAGAEELPADLPREDRRLVRYEEDVEPVPGAEPGQLPDAPKWLGQLKELKRAREKGGGQSSGSELSITRTLSPRTVIGIGTTDS
jgi:hypothetical protein